MTSTDTIDVN